MASNAARKIGFREAAGRLYRTTAFRLSAVYLLIFVAFAVFVLGYLAWNTRRLLDAQITETINTEINALAEQSRLGGQRRLINLIERRSRQSGSFLYILVDQKGDAVTGNAILRVSPLTLRPGWIELPYSRPDDSEDPRRLAKIRVFVLDSGHRLVVGRDLEERALLREAVRRARGWSLFMVLVLGAFGAWFVTRRVLGRIDAIALSSGRIMEGNLTERLPVSENNDEFDRLATHLNQMLDRIGGLMSGLRELSDNVAHDLRTPLTRMRNGVEESLRKAKTFEDSREALEKAIDEADQLIRIFDALLTISRAEAGNLVLGAQPLDVLETVSGIGELYEPLVEEAGMSLRVEIPAGISVLANRELLGRALSNLIDNALKYGKAAGNTAGEIVLSARTVGDRIEIAVADRGRGIPEADRVRVVERFVRLDPSRAKPGFGLGLSLVTAVARMMGGELRLEDNLPGLRAVLVLPAALADDRHDVAE